MEDARLSAPAAFGALGALAPDGPPAADAPPGLGADGGLTRLLLEHPRQFGFFQAVRLLERERGARTPVGGFGDPAAEVVRFGANPAVAFPPTEIAAAAAEEGQARMRVNFFGLNGPQGVLPLEYSMYVAERLRAKDPTLRDFLDLFNHRAVSLLYRAWLKGHVAASYERDGADDVTRHLFDLVGLGTPALRGRLPLPDEALLHYAGLLAATPRSAIALEQLVGDFFGVPARVDQFVGAWYPVESAAQCRLGEGEDETTALGAGALAGDEVWDQQSRARIRLGPMGRAAYERFLPGGESYEALRSLTRFFARDEIDFELQLVLAEPEVPGAALGEAPLPLGWSTWLRSRPDEPFGRDADETVFTL
jgi:type VI secretion system protein ImpH